MRDARQCRPSVLVRHLQTRSYIGDASDRLEPGEPPGSVPYRPGYCTHGLRCRPSACPSNTTPAARSSQTASSTTPSAPGLTRTCVNAAASPGTPTCSPARPRPGGSRNPSYRWVRGASAQAALSSQGRPVPPGSRPHDSRGLQDPQEHESREPAVHRHPSFGDAGPRGNWLGQTLCPTAPSSPATRSSGHLSQP